MKYITCAQAAEQWNVGSRIVQRWCQQGRIPGAVKDGRSYRIPAGSEPPADRRFHEETENVSQYLSMVSNPDYPAKNDFFALRFTENLELYYKGHYAEAEQGFFTLLSEAAGDGERLPVLTILSTLESQFGEPDSPVEIHRQIRQILSSGKYPLYEQYVAVFHDRAPVMPKNDIPLEILPPFLLWSTRNLLMKALPHPDQLSAQHLEILCRYAETTGSEMIQAFFHAMLAVAYLFFGDANLQNYHQDKAREIILRRRWYLMFAEYYYFLDWKLEQYVQDPEALRFIHDLNEKLFRNYIRFACSTTAFTRPELMKPELLKVAVLRCFCRSNSEISRCMNISPYYVRKYIEELNICTGNADREQLMKIVFSVMWFM